ncbi:MAG: STAS/SEC14 domain-containing protein [Syntrophobacteraceae bacterium]|nr:STAS/SEC14 domain-containing protein [Syntrophobacteraceae bacterium]
MIEILPESADNVLIFKASGKLTDSDYKDVLIPRLEAIIGEYGKARLLVDVDKFQGWEAEAMWDDARFGLAHRNDFDKMAIVGGPGWFEWATKLARLIMSGSIRSFSPSEREEAMRWIKLPG